MTSEPDGAPPPPPEAEPPADPPREQAAAPPREQAAPPPREQAAPPPAKRRWTRHTQLWILVAGCAAIVASNVYFISRGPVSATAGSGSASAAASASAPPPAHGEGADAPLAASASAGAPTLDTDAGPAPEADEPAHGDEPPPSEKPDKTEKPDKHKAGTVGEMAKRACSTAPIEGLSRQIIAEARCLDANAFARVPARKNLENGGHVFLYLDAPARDHLLRALDAHPNKTLKVHSALRTVAQQYLLSRWGAGKRCGVQLANRPGESNHETGLALDVGDPTAWRSALENEGFRWLGKIDRVHFDFVGPGATHHDGLDVRAFQRLWNRNHPDDTISESGRYDGATEVRLKKSPAGGFPIGARCGGGSARASAGPR